MCIRQEIRTEVAVLRLSGEMASKLDAAPFQAHIERLLRNGVTCIVVDCAEVKWLGAAMLGELVAAREVLLGAGGNVHLAGINDKTKEIIGITNLVGTLQVLDSVDLAVASLRNLAVEPQVA